MARLAMARLSAEAVGEALPAARVLLAAPVEVQMAPSVGQLPAHSRAYHHRVAVGAVMSRQCVSKSNETGTVVRKLELVCPVNSSQQIYRANREFAFAPQ